MRVNYRSNLFCESLCIDVELYGARFNLIWYKDSYSIVYEKDGYLVDGMRKLKNRRRRYLYLQKKRTLFLDDIADRDASNHRILIAGKFAHLYRRKLHAEKLSFCMDELLFHTRVRRLYNLSLITTDAFRPFITADLGRLEYSDAFRDALPYHLNLFLFAYSLDVMLGPFSDTGYTTSESLDSIGVESMSSNDSHDFGDFVLSDHDDRPDDVSVDSFFVAEHNAHYDDWMLDMIPQSNLVQMDEKEFRREKFKVRDAGGKRRINKVVDKIANLSKSDRKKLIATLKKMEIQSGVVDMVMQTILPYFVKFPMLKPLIIEILSLSVGIYQATSRDQVIFHILASVARLALNCSDEITKVVNDFFITEQSMADDFGNLLKKGLETWKGFADGKVVDDIKKGVIILVSLGFSSVASLASHLPNLKSLLSDSSLLKITSFDIITYGLELILNLYGRIQAVVETRSLKSFFCPVPRLIKLSNRYDALVAKFPHALAGNLPDHFDMTLEDYDMELRLVHREFSKIARDVATSDKHNVLRWKEKLAGMIADMDYYLTTQPVRRAPYSLNIIGSSGVGKTNLVTIFALALAKCYDLKVTKDTFHYRNAADEYFSGYNGQKIIVEDDKNATKASPGGIDENAMTINIVNNAVMPLVMAAVDDKGKHVMRADIHIMTTNVPDAQAAILSNEPPAVLRRSHHFVIEVRHGYTLPNSTMLDPSKCSGRPLEDDAWMITILSVDVIARAQNVAAGWNWRTVTHNGRLMNRVGIHDAMIYLRETCDQHILHQSNIISGFNDLLANTQLCEHGSGINICRICHNIPEPHPVQSSVDMGHTHLGKPIVGRGDPLGRGTGLTSQAGLVSMIASTLFEWVWYNILPYILWIVQVSKNIAASFWIGAFLRRIGLGCLFSPNCALHITESVDSHIWSRSLALYLCVWIPYYCCIAALSTYMYGLNSWSILFWGDGVANLSWRCTQRFYAHMDRRGARNTLRDIIARRTRRYLEHNLHIVAVTAAVAGALTCYKLINRARTETQGSIISVPQTNGWAKMYIPPEDVEDKRKTTTFVGLNTSISNRIAHVWLFSEETRKSGKGVPGNVLPLKSGAFLCPKHYFFNETTGESNGFEFMHIKLNGSELGNSLRDVPIDMNQVFPVGDGDMCIFYVSAMCAQMRDLTPYLSDVHRDTSANYIHRSSDGKLMEGDTMVRLQYYDNIDGESLYYTECPFPTFVGLCGAVQVANTKIPYIASMHIRGVPGKSTARCQPIYRREVMAALDKLFQDKFTIQTGSMEMMDYTDGDSSKVLVKEIHPKSPFAHLESGSVYYIGRLAERSKPTGTVINTAICGDVEKEFGVTNVYGNPSFLRSWKPYYAAVENLVNPTPKHPPTWRAAIEMQHKTILDALKKKDILYAEPLDELTILSGLDGDDMMKRMDLSTSSGYPLRCAKGEFIDVEYNPTDPLHQCHYILHESARVRIEAARERCNQGLRPNFVFSSNLKVEPKSLFEKGPDGELVDKVSMPRVFYASNFECLFLMRQYFMPIMKILMNVVESEMSIGINVMGPDWGKLANRLLAISSSILEADQSKYDQSVTPDEMIPQFNFWIEVARLCGYDQKALRIMKVLVGCVINPIIDMNSDLVMFYCLLVSGMLGTAQMNSLINGARFRALFVHIYNDNDSFVKLVNSMNVPLEDAYNKLVCANFFGDDSLVSVSRSIEEYFNMESFAEFMGRFGVNVTTAAKGIVSEKLMNIEDVDYLKRSFRFDVERQVWTAPLNEKSLFKRLMVLIPSSVLTHEEQCAEAIINTLRDYFEYGRDIFNSNREKLLRIAIKHKLLTHIHTFYTYDQLVEEYNIKHKTTPAVMRG